MVSTLRQKVDKYKEANSALKVLHRLVYRIQKQGKLSEIQNSTNYDIPDIMLTRIAS